MEENLVNSAMCGNCWKNFEDGKGYLDHEGNLFCSKECCQEYRDELKKEFAGVNE